MEKAKRAGEKQSGKKQSGKRRSRAKQSKERRSKEEQRRYNMSRIRGSDTSIEVSFRKALWHRGIRYRKNYKLLHGKPDIAITKHKIAIFCDGEFWHGREWDTKKESIKSNTEYWTSKIETNIRRDRLTDQKLKSEGWVVLRFWGEELQRNTDLCVQEVIDAIAQAEIDRAIAGAEIRSRYEQSQDGEEQDGQN